MAGYQDLLDAYANNHQALGIIRGSIRDATNSIRSALLLRMGLSPKSELVIIATEGGTDLFGKISTLEHKDTLRAKVCIVLNGAEGAPETSVSTCIHFKVSDGKVVIDLPTLGHSQAIIKPDDFNEIAGTIYEAALIRLTDY
jgi:hypothetical protein